MGSRYRKQEEVRLELEGGDWLLVRKHLTAGEERDMYAKAIKLGTFKSGQRPDLDPDHVGIAQIIAYLIDWSITDENDKPIRVRDASYEFVYAALRAQTGESFREILTAVQAHETAMDEETEREKKLRDGVSVP